MSTLSFESRWEAVLALEQINILRWPKPNEKVK